MIQLVQQRVSERSPFSRFELNLLGIGRACFTSETPFRPNKKSISTNIMPSHLIVLNVPLNFGAMLI